MPLFVPSIRLFSWRPIPPHKKREEVMVARHHHIPKSSASVRWIKPALILLAAGGLLANVQAPAFAQVETANPDCSPREDCHWYASVKQTYTSFSGVHAVLDQPTPHVDKGSFSLAEIVAAAPRSQGDGINAVEFGWVVFPDKFGDSKSHLFVKPTAGPQETLADCWGPSALNNGDCHWHPATGAHPAPNTQDTVDGNPAKFAIQADHDGNWHIKYRDKELGFFDRKLWESSENPLGFLTGSSAQWYGEVSTPYEPGPSTILSGNCTWMGNGEPGDAEPPASPAKFTDLGVDDPVGAQAFRLSEPQPKFYSLVGPGEDHPFFTYGGYGNRNRCQPPRSSRSGVSPSAGQHQSVAAGDSLWALAEKVYGSGTQWQKIYEANKALIENAAHAHGFPSSRGGNLIFPGLNLVIPPA
ncbi:neprosin family prolyl endopeptidase [Streptomyces sp. NPDC006476]|uniref:neprosin family prolyl endopeptidase n=1 Tax=Streptomyces sp. NPDC006476 TaxID=3157175 RepID=UPI0033B18FCB